ncbi:recombination mediator RecR [Amphritea sp. 1_MG-2023]|uniref:recombination mediator RecR n=1 Tax=Amphritea sp. 1_MG-2023 TaxID=3062670 RepID=UPI0026E386FB|nr:recombination mediator RecR [Amphritea sp. 1_MG-2023]MDO6561812.1 recombination mediator RecR [Amphritea sp. 1_MG-2023]
MSFSPLIQDLIDAFRVLPGVGPKTAQRMAFHLLERDRQGANTLAAALTRSADKVGHCRCCRTLSENELCDICADNRRDESQICVLESPVDMLAIEQTGGFNGGYFVLMGHLSPIDGVGPDDLGLDQLFKRLESGAVKELILATNPTVEGEATAHFIAAQIKHLDIRITRIAHGVPVGGELEYVDGGTLAHAMAGRRSMN